MVRDADETVIARRGSAIAVIVTGVGLHTGALGGQVTTAQYDNARTGWAAHETVLRPGNVNPSSFGKVATLAVDGDVYAQPLFLPRVALPGAGIRGLLIVATERNSVYAFDAASHSATPVWRVSMNQAMGAMPLDNRDVHCPFIRPDIGITPTPVIDSASGTIYVLARTKVRTATGGFRFEQHLHALDVRSGADRRPPALIDAAVAGTGAGSQGGRLAFDPLRENPRGALLLVNGTVYLSWASSCDVGPYHGWIMAYDAATLVQKAVFNTTPNGAEGGIWQSDAGLAADSSGNVYAVTGNGTFDIAAAARRDYGNTVLRLARRDSSLIVRDFFTPSNQAALSGQDADLGSSGPVPIPEQPGDHRRLLVVTGKDGTTYLLDRDAMGQYAVGTRTKALQAFKTSEGGFGAAAYWNHTVYIWGSLDMLKAFAIEGGKLVQRGAGATRFTDPGATPVVSSNGSRDGILWAVETRTWNGADKVAVLHAYDAGNVARELFNSEMNPGRDRAGLATRFAMPTVAAGFVYVGAKMEVDVYGLVQPHNGPATR